MVGDNVEQMEFPSPGVKRVSICSSVSLGSLKPVNVVSDAFSNY